MSGNSQVINAHMGNLVGFDYGNVSVHSDSCVGDSCLASPELILEKKPDFINLLHLQAHK